jgi:trimethylamine:corrinoid methyltransferase-like protein
MSGHAYTRPRLLFWKIQGCGSKRPKGRRILKEVGALVDDTSKIVRFPQRLIIESLKLAPKEFILGARRPGAELKMNGGDCTLCLDGSGTMVLDHTTGERRPATICVSCQRCLQFAGTNDFFDLFYVDIIYSQVIIYL